MNQRYLSWDSSSQAPSWATGSSAGRHVGRAGAPFDHDDQADADQQDADRRHHEDVGTVRDQRSREEAARHGADRAPPSDDREQPLALLGAVDVRGERPELRHHGVTEHADPQEERQADRQGGSRQDREHHEVRGEEQEHDDEQLEAPEPARETAVDVNHAHHQDGLCGPRVKLHLCSALQEDERFADRLEQVIGRQQQKGGQGHEGDGRRLFGMNLGERTKYPGENIGESVAHGPSSF